MKTILSPGEAENSLDKLSENDRHKIDSDKIRYGEYFIGEENQSYFRIDPLYVVMAKGRPVSIKPDDSTII